MATQKEPILIVMEFVDGGGLNDYLKKAYKADNVVPMKEKTDEILLPAGWGIEYLHSQKCIHRDISARNCLYTKDKIVSSTVY